MLNPIEIAYQTGATLYAVIHSALAGTVWNQTNSAFESYNSAHWTQYAVALTEQTSSGYYSAAAPAGIGNILTTECVYSQVGGSPALSDAAPGPISIGQAQGVDIASVVPNPTAAGNMQINLLQLQAGSVTSSIVTTISFSTNLVSSVTNLYVGRLLIMTSGTLAQEVVTITGYNGTTKVLSFSPLTSLPSAGDGFLIV